MSLANEYDDETANVNPHLYHFCRKANCTGWMIADRVSGRGDGELRCPVCGGELVGQETTWIYEAEKNRGDAS